MAASASTRLRLRVTATAETLLRKGNPWLFADSVREQNRDGKLGEIAVIFDRNDKFLAVGLFDPESPIRVRILHAGKPRNIDAEFWNTRLDEALHARAGMFDAETTGYRCINGESDGCPALVVDRYADTLVVKLYSGIWFPRIEEILNFISAKIPHRTIVLRLSRNIQKLAEQFNLRDGQIMRGESFE